MGSLRDPEVSPRQRDYSRSMTPCPPSRPSPQHCILPTPDVSPEQGHAGESPPIGLGDRRDTVPGAASGALGSSETCPALRLGDLRGDPAQRSLSASSGSVPTAGRRAPVVEIFSVLGEGKSHSAFADYQKAASPTHHDGQQERPASAISAELELELEGMDDAHEEAKAREAEKRTCLQAAYAAAQSVPNGNKTPGGHASSRQQQPRQTTGMGKLADEASAPASEPTVSSPVYRASPDPGRPPVVRQSERVYSSTNHLLGSCPRSPTRESCTPSCMDDVASHMGPTEEDDESEEPAHGYRLLVDNISYFASRGPGQAPKRILDGACVQLDSATMCALMGPSGCGKTTLLNCIAGRITPSSGRVLVRAEGAAAVLDVLSEEQKVAYVMQDDVLPAMFSVREYLAQQARLRMPEDTPAAELDEKVDSLIATLGLSSVAHQRLGGTGRVSSGERKKVAIAAEMLSNPCILLLDEPTTGLDNHSAETVIRWLRDEVVVRQGRTVIATIHQPSPRMLECFSHLVLLAQGQILCSDDPFSVMDWFSERFGYRCPEGMTWADFFLRVCRGKGSEHFTEVDWKAEDFLDLDYDEQEEEESPPATDPDLQCRSTSAAVEQRLVSSTTDNTAAIKLMAATWAAYFGSLRPPKQGAGDRVVADAVRELSAVQGADAKAGLTPAELQSALENIGCAITYSQVCRITEVISGEKGGQCVTRRQLADFLRKRRPKPRPLKPTTICSRRMQLRVLTSRLLQQQWRDAAQAKGTFMYAFFVGFVLAVCFWGMEPDPAGIDKFRGMMSLVISASVSIGNQQLSLIHTEKRIVDREMASRLYSPVVYFLSKCLVTLPVTIGAAMLFPVPLYFTTGMYSASDRPELVPFFAVLVTCGLLAATTEGISFVFGSLPLTFEASRMLHSVIDLPFKTLNGYFVSRATVPVYFAWLYEVGPYGLAYESNLDSQFNDRRLDCDDPTGRSCFQNGDQLVRYYGIHHNAVARALLACFVWSIVTRAIATLIYYRVAKGRTPEQ